MGQSKGYVDVPLSPRQRKPQAFVDVPVASVPQGSALGRFASGAGEMLNPVTMVKGLYQAVTNPIDTAVGIYDQQGQQFDKAVQSAREGRYSEMVGHGAAAFVPVVGPLAADIGEQAGRGDVAGAAGRLAGGALAWQAPKLAKKLPAGVKVGGSSTPEAELAKWGLDQGIPVDVASATANPIPRAAQQIATRTTVTGSMVGTKAAKARQAGLATVGEQLAAKGYAPAASKESAGAAARAGVETSLRGFDDTANQSYGKLRQLEGSSAPQSVATGTKTSTIQTATDAVDAAGNPVTQSTRVVGPVMATLKAPVDLRPMRPELKPILDRLNRKKELTGQLMGDEGRAAVALDRLVNGDDFAGLVDVDAALGDLKSMARGAAMPELRSGGQSIAAAAVSRLSKAVDAAAEALGPEAVDALKTGRLATRQKYAAADVLDALKSEPVKTANAAAAPADTAVMHLRDLQRFAPESLPQVGKAVVSDLLTEAAKDGGFNVTASIANKWQKLGPETKSLLFKDPAYIKDLDRFFQLGKKVSENANPSGSAFVGALTAQGYMFIDPVTLTSYQLAGGALAKALNSPKLTRLLVEGTAIPLRAKAAATARFQRFAPLLDQATKSGASQNTGLQPSKSP